MKKQLFMAKYNLIVILLILFIANACNENNNVRSKPNIIIVLADDLGYGDVKAFNEHCKIKTPNLDRMASAGMIFTDAHTSSSVCSPTRYGLLTGRYNWRTTLKRGVLNGTSTALIPENRTTIASILKNHGYHTAFIGKWHLGWNWALLDTSKKVSDYNIDFSKPISHSPNDLGFEYAYGHSTSLGAPPYVYVENEQPTAIPQKDTENSTPDRMASWHRGPTADDFIHEDVTPNFFRRSFAYIEEVAKSDNPFFLYLALPSPHTPILPTEEWKGKSGLNAYGDFVMMIDNYMGQLLDVIKDAGIEKNTMLVFTSDNGCSGRAKIDQLQEKGHFPSYLFRGEKSKIYEGGHRVPFIVKWPRVISKGRESDEIICTTDFLATMAEIVGDSLADNEGEDSYSLVPLFENQELNSALREATVHHSWNGSFAIRKGDWKLIMCPEHGGWFPKDHVVDATLPPYQLYNLKEDPGETKNLLELNSQKTEELKALLTKYILRGRSTPGMFQANDPVSSWDQISFITMN